MDAMEMETPESRMLDLSPEQAQSLLGSDPQPGTEYNITLRATDSGSFEVVSAEPASEEEESPSEHPSDPKEPTEDVEASDEGMPASPMPPPVKRKKPTVPPVNMSSFLG